MSDGVPVTGPAAVLVGRESERAQIDAFVASVPSEQSSLTIIGESGIGKTALWRYAIASSRDHGFRVLISRPAEEEMPLSGIGLIDLFERAALPEASVGADDPIAAGRAVLEVLRDTVAERPAVLAIDDVQWLDSFSAHSLRYALRRLETTEPLAVVMTLRPEGVPADPLAVASILPAGRRHIVEPGPLNLDEIRRLIGDSAGAMSRPTLRRISDLSAGNPLYALELARNVRTKGADASADTLLPDSVQVAIGDRIAGYPEELRALLETVSAMGRPSVASLRETRHSEDLDELLGIAQQEGALVVEDDLTIRFSHPMVGSVVYAGIDPIARQRLHADLAAIARDPDLRARHLALSAEEADPDVATLLEDAAIRASRRGSPDLAAEFTSHSLRLTPADDEVAVRRRRLLQIGDLAASGEAGRALELADELLVMLPHGPGRAAVLVQRFKVEDDDLAFGERLLEEALDDAGEDEGLRGRVLDMLAWLRGVLRGNLQDGIASAQAGTEIAERIGDDPLRMLSESSLALLQALVGDPQPELMEHALELERSIGAQGTNESPRALAGKLRFWSGDLPGARELFDEALRLAAREGNELTRPYRLYDLSLLECAAGNLAEAQELARLGIEAAEDAQFPPGSLHYPSALVSAWMGDVEEALRGAELLHEWAGPRGERPAVVRALMVKGLIALSDGNAGKASDHLGKAVALLEDIGVIEPGAFPVLPDAIEARARSGDHVGSVALLARLEAHAERSNNAWALAAADRCRGAILVSDGEPDDAIAPLQRSADAFDGLGFRPEAARAVLLLGQSLLRGGHRTAAADALVDARERFASMGAASWEGQALEELERAAPGRGSGGLTPTERQIAVLVAEGMKNREIAQSMFVSIATVEAHLTRIYRKLQIGSRAELTRLVVEHGLPSGLEK